MAATVHTWQSTTGVWSSVNSWTTGQIPGAGGAGLDTALLDGNFSQIGVIGETPGGNALSRIVTTRDYRGNIGSDGNPLIVDVSSHLIAGNLAFFGGTGTVYFEDVVGNHTDVVIDTHSLSRHSHIYLYGPLRNLFVKSGRFTTTVGASFGALSMLGSHARGRVTYAGDLSTDYWVNSGELEITAGSTQNIVMSGGRLIHTGLLKSTAVITLLGNGKLVYAPTGSVAGHSPDLFLLGGEFDISQLNEAFIAAALVVGPDATVRGNVIGRVGGGSGITTTIDLQDEFPSVP